MSQALFLRNIIAVIWDFDKTLIPDYMQRPLFRKFGVDEGEFWREVNGLGAHYLNRGLEVVASDMIYLNHILTYVREGRFKGLTNRMLEELGKEIEFYPGLPAAFPALKEWVEGHGAWAKHGVRLEHYVVSTGLRRMIMGSEIAPYVDDVWACEFIEEPPAPPGYLGETPPLPHVPGEICQIGYSIDNTTKTRALFEINKGTNRHPEINVNAKIDEDKRRIPFHNMVYIADGPSDVPVFSILNRAGGHTFAVYKPGSDKEFEQVKSLQDQDRIDSFGPADYTESSQTMMWLRSTIRRIADRIVEDRDEALGDAVGEAPRHLSED